MLSVFGALYLFIEALDFFDLYTRDKYASYAFFLVLLVAIVVAVVFKRPVKAIVLEAPSKDFSIQVKIADLFLESGALMISTNTDFEADVAGGKIAVDSLQGQFTAKYFTGNQNELIEQLESSLAHVPGKKPYPIGTVATVNTHGKTFYFLAMAHLNDHGNAHTTQREVANALDSLWTFVRDSGELQELVLPVIGTGRGRLQVSRKKMIGIMAESFYKASENGLVSTQLTIVVRPEDASQFQVNLYDIKDFLRQMLLS